jgi:hypothetical protein
MVDTYIWLNDASSFPDCFAARRLVGVTNKDVAAVLCYQLEAVKLDSGKSPDIGEPPARF